MNFVPGPSCDFKLELRPRGCVNYQCIIVHNPSSAYGNNGGEGQSTLRLEFRGRHRLDTISYNTRPQEPSRQKISGEVPTPYYFPLRPATFFTFHGALRPLEHLGSFFCACAAISAPQHYSCRTRRAFAQARPSEEISSDVQSENCLTINLFRPSGISDHASLHILFWTYVCVHFLAHIVGSRSFRVPQGEEGEQKANYGRALLTTVEPANIAGILNPGLRDQLKAMEWVQNNIGAFGGDKNKVCCSVVLTS